MKREIMNLKRTVMDICEYLEGAMGRKNGVAIL